MLREIVLDTETTGLDPRKGDRVVEIGCVELVNRFPTGRTYHQQINPERDVPREAFDVHGLSTEFLATMPKFAEIADAFLDFIGDASLVIHNASFDHGFLCAELALLKRTPIAHERLVDTLLLARRKHPGSANRLDDLCVRYKIDNSKRTKHGALLDAELLAEVYLELIGARQASLGLMDTVRSGQNGSGAHGVRVRPAPLPSRLSAEERAAHEAFVASLGEAAVWLKYG
jgi:DNA polymerase-3 subunit epsilon